MLTHPMKTRLWASGVHRTCSQLQRMPQRARWTQGPSEISHHTCQVMRRVHGLIKDRGPEDAGQVWRRSREDERRSDEVSYGVGEW